MLVTCLRLLNKPPAPNHQVLDYAILSHEFKKRPPICAVCLLSTYPQPHPQYDHNIHLNSTSLWLALSR